MISVYLFLRDVSIKIKKTLIYIIIYIVGIRIKQKSSLP